MKYIGYKVLGEFKADDFNIHAFVVDGCDIFYRHILLSERQIVSSTIYNKNEIMIMCRYPDKYFIKDRVALINWIKSIEREFKISQILK